MKSIIAALIIFAMVSSNTVAQPNNGCDAYIEGLLAIGDRLRSLPGEQGAMVGEINDIFDDLITLSPPPMFTEAHLLIVGATHYLSLAAISDGDGDSLSTSRYLTEAGAYTDAFAAEFDTLPSVCEGEVS